MTKTKLILHKKVLLLKVSDILKENKIEKLIIIDKQSTCKGLITVTDIEKSQKCPLATKDSIGRLRVQQQLELVKIV